VEERTGLSEFTFSRVLPVFARGCFVIAVDSSKGSFAKVLW